MWFSHFDTPPGNEVSSGNASLHWEHGVRMHTVLRIETFMPWRFPDPFEPSHRISPPPCITSCRAMIFQLLVFVFFVTTAFSSPINPHLVCEGKRWESIFTFFATNYIAHALTIVPDPGANWFAQIVFSFTALMVPNIGLIGAIQSVTRHLLQGRSDDLRRALAQGALLILVKTENIRDDDIEIKINS